MHQHCTNGTYNGRASVDDLMSEFVDASTRMAGRSANEKAKLDSFLKTLRSIGWEPGLSEESYLQILTCGFRGKNLTLAAIAAEISCDENPLTLRGLFYRVVSAGVLPSTDANGLQVHRSGKRVYVRGSALISYVEGAAE